MTAIRKPKKFANTTQRRVVLPEIAHIWRDYQELGSVRKVGEAYGCSHSTIYDALKRAGYRLNGEKWTAEEDVQVTDFYRNTPPEQFDVARLADQMRRNVHGVHMRAFRLGLTESRSTRQKSTQAKQGGGARLTAHQREHGHARGMKGKKHTPETLERLSQAGKEMWENMPETVKDERNVKILRTKAERGILPPGRPNASWKAGWRDVAGRRIYFRSQWEVNYAHYLQWLKDLKQIKEWEFEAETFWFEGIKRGVMSYLPDFRVTENNGQVVYHEIKGWMDDRSKTKIKRMAKYHPTVKLIVIDKQTYRALARQVRNVVPGWE